MESFTKKLMDTLAQNARQQKEASQKEMLDKIAHMRQFIEQSNINPEIKESVFQLMNKIQSF